MTQAETTRKSKQKSDLENLSNAQSRDDQSEKTIKFAQDLLGVLLLAFGAVLLLAVLGLTKGGFITPLVMILKQSFGIGRFFVAFAVFVAGGSLLVWRKNQPKNVKVGKLVLFEMSFFAFLGVLSCFVDMAKPLSEAVSGIRAGSSLGGIVGFGLSILLVNVIGRIATGILFLVLSIILFLFGSGKLAGLERWAARKAGMEVLPSKRHARLSSGYDEPVKALPEPIEEQVKEPVFETIIRRERPKKPEQDATAIRSFDYSGFVRERQTVRKAKSQVKLPEREVNLPPLSLLATEKTVNVNTATINMNAGLIEQTLADFDVPAKVVSYRIGPTITQYAVEPGYYDASNDEKYKVKVSQISSLSRDLALALKAERLRIQAPVPGESFVGIEVPNNELGVVRLKPLLESEAFLREKSPLTLPLGRDVSGTPVISDLSSMPHLLIAGATNSGKSICIAAITLSLVMNNHPNDLKLVMIDPKRVELSRFNGLPHLLGQVETKADRIMAVLRWATTEMDFRYEKLEKVQARNLESYNRRMRKSGRETMPRIVIMIDELADLMISQKDDTEKAITRIAQKARAVGMHLIVATQRPSTDVITGLIKANFPTRISFSVASMIDSRVILDFNGAENLLGKGDMLFMHAQSGVPMRAQCTYVDDKEIQGVLDWWSKNCNVEKQTIPIDEIEPQKTESSKTEISATEEEEAPWEAIVLEEGERDSDEAIIQDAIALVRKQKRASASFLQRQLRIGYPKAAWLIDQLEGRGVIGPAQGGGRDREILEESDDFE